MTLLMQCQPVEEFFNQCQPVEEWRLPVEEVSQPVEEFFNQCQPVEEWRLLVEEFSQSIEAKALGFSFEDFKVKGGLRFRELGFEISKNKEKVIGWALRLILRLPRIRD